MDIAHGEMVEKELDTLMVRRAKKAEKTQSREELWKAQRAGRRASTSCTCGKVSHKHREEETRSLIDTIGRTRVEQEADKA